MAVSIDVIEKALLSADLNQLKGYKFKTGGTLLEPEKMVNSHLVILRANSKHTRFIPYYGRLLELYNQLNK